MTVYAITDTKKGRTGIAPTHLQTTPARHLIITSRSHRLKSDSIQTCRILAYFVLGRFHCPGWCTMCSDAVTVRTPLVDVTILPTTGCCSATAAADADEDGTPGKPGNYRHFRQPSSRFSCRW